MLQIILQKYQNSEEQWVRSLFLTQGPDDFSPVSLPEGQNGDLHIFLHKTETLNTSETVPFNRHVFLQI